MRALRILVLMAAIASLTAVAAQAQVVTAPTRAEFTHPDSEYNITATYHVDFYQCGSLVAGVCTNRAATPFATGADVPKSAVTGTAALRVLQFASTPVPGVLQAMPLGVAFVAAAVAVGDPAVGGVGSSPPSADSNPFFPRGRTPASPTSMAVR